ncbi:protein TONSOKU isoform X2 [Ricinus communis]|uniref:protein TONSOKU isoform X2 n=1 Tax=Ricinus communis TaxID=3988 RepID=UPI00201A4D0D|nr:protein TONSOKU isoform X2 [Ricinus communis]
MSISFQFEKSFAILVHFGLCFCVFVLSCTFNFQFRYLEPNFHQGFFWRQKEAMGKDDRQLIAAKQAYRSAKEVGNRQEEARWANVIGDILKNRGEYVVSIKWLRIDYQISIKYLPEKHLLPTCQSLGEVYLRLHDHEQALLYQKKHLELAKDASDIIEQQRASTQLGRTYHEIFLKSEDDHSAVRNAKKYFKSAMKLAQNLKENPPSASSSFLKEYIDAHNNIGMLEMDLDNLGEAEEVLTKGLQICEEEEVSEDDDGRSRLHHNLGNVYIERREWSKARDHIEKDIIICKRIGHCQGEAKGYINLGELHYRVQKYEEAIRCYHRALDLAKSMEDEDVLAKQINQNIETVKEAIKVLDELKKEEQHLKKLMRSTVNATDQSHEKKLFRKQHKLLDRLIEKSSMIFAWEEHCKYAKWKKRIAKQLYDKEKLGDSFLILGESYHKRRSFDKAIKWLTKSWEMYTLIGNLEGQALAKISMGDVLDCNDDWVGALKAFEESYRIAVEANLPSVQLSALENMHYSHMIRFDNVEEARRLQNEMSNLKQSKRRELETQNLARDCCSETDTDEDDDFSDNRSNPSHSPKNNSSGCTKSKNLAGVEELNDDLPLISFLQPSKQASRKKTACIENCNTCDKLAEVSPKCLSKTSNQQTVVGRKRVRVVISDDEGEIQNEENFGGRFHEHTVDNVATSDGFKEKNNLSRSAHECQDFSRAIPKCATNNVDISASLMHRHRAACLKLHNFANDNKQCIVFRIDDAMLRIEGGPSFAADDLSIESIKVELACLYYLQLPMETRSKGLLPIIQHMKCAGKVLESLEAFETLEDHLGSVLIDVSINGWVQKRLMKLYIDFCEELSEPPNMKLLKELYISEVEDEIVASGCELQDISITPLLNALHAHKTVAMIDLSHNILGNGTMEKLQQLLTSGQKYGGLTLDLHCNRFGPTALFQICECPVLFTRLEVLNISGNRLTDACGSYLSTILEKCKALYSLNIERCSITSRTIQKVADALTSGSVLSQLSIGHNNQISGNAIVNLLTKLAALKSFAELNLSGIKINRPVTDNLCQLAKISCLSRVMLGSTGIGTDGAVQVTESLFSGSQEYVKLDLSYCGLTAAYAHQLNIEDTLVCGILELNLEGNPIMQEGVNAITSLLVNPRCCLKVLVLNKCQLGLTGVLQVIKTLSENHHLEELHVADNSSQDEKHMMRYDSTTRCSADLLQPNFSTSESSLKVCGPKKAETENEALKVCAPEKADINHEALCAVNTDCNQLEVADSEDNEIRVEAGPEFDDSCTSSSQKNSSLECQFIQELSAAISMAKQLKLLDLSNNGFSNPVAETLSNAWSSRFTTDVSWRHIKDQIIHFSMSDEMCCRRKPCCRKD